MPSIIKQSPTPASPSPTNTPTMPAPPRLHNPRLPHDKPDISIPQARRIAVDTTGAQIVQEESVATRDSRGIYLPHYIEPVSHIAIDIGGSLAKVVYFTRSSAPILHTPPATTPSSPFLPPSQSVSSPNAQASSSRLPDDLPDLSHSPTNPESRLPTVNGALKPQALVEDYLSVPKHSAYGQHRQLNGYSKGRRFSSSPQLPQPLPGGLLNFARFETANIDDLIRWLADLIATSAAANRVTLDRMKSTVKVMVTGGGAYMYNDRLAEELGVEVMREEEMESLILGLGFVARIPEEVFWFSEELVYKVSHPDPTTHHCHNALPNGDGEELSGDEERRGKGMNGSRSRDGSPTTATFSDPSADGQPVMGISKDMAQISISSAGNTSEIPTEADPIPHITPPSPQPAPDPTIASADSAPSAKFPTKSKPSLKLPSVPQPDLERPSPTPPQYSVTFATPSSDPNEEPEPNFPCLVVNIGSGVSIVRVDEDGKFERVSGTSLGGGTLWGLLSLLTDARSFDEMLLLSEKGDNTEVDMLVGDIYGSDYSKIGLKSSTIASTFGKVFKKGQSAEERKKGIRQEDVARSLLYAVSNNIGHVAYMNAAKYGLNKVFFSGCFIRGELKTSRPRRLTVSALAKFFAGFSDSSDGRPIIVLDPVMISTSGHTLVAAAAMQKIKTELIPHVDWLTPNIPEAMVLAGLSEPGETEHLDSIFDLMGVMESMDQAAGVKNLLLKGGHLPLSREDVVSFARAAAKSSVDTVRPSAHIPGHASTISTLSYAIRFWSKGTMRACFLRHEGFLGAIGAWIKNVEQLEETDNEPNGVHLAGLNGDGAEE